MRFEKVLPLLAHLKLIGCRQIGRKVRQEPEILTPIAGPSL
jgi:hypothetical protein